MAKTIAIFNRKGGAGKTTTASCLMSALKLKNYKVLGIDIDGQGNLTDLCKVDTKNQNTILEVLSGEATFEETVKTTDFGDLIPCDDDVIVFDKEASKDMNKVFAMQEIIEKVGDKYDFIIIDCPPDINNLSVSALIGSDYVIIPTEIEYFHIGGVTKVAIEINRAKKKLNPNLKVLGVLITRYQPRRKLTKSNEVAMGEFCEQTLGCNLFKTKIPVNVAISDSQMAKMSIFDYDKKSKGAKAYMEFAEEVIKGVKENG